MTLPQVNTSRLQRVVFDVEMRRGAFKDFGSLCMAIAQSNWANEEGLDDKVIGELIVEHKIITKTPKPEPKVVEASVPPPPPKAEESAPKPKRVRKGQSEAPKVVEEPKAEAPKVVEPKPTPPPEPAKQPEQILVPAKSESPSVTTKDDGRSETGGRGKKQCPACKKYVGVRCGECPCGHAFVKSAPLTPTSPAVAPTATATVEPVKDTGWGHPPLMQWYACRPWRNDRKNTKDDPITLAEFEKMVKKRGLDLNHPDNTGTAVWDGWVREVLIHVGEEDCRTGIKDLREYWYVDYEAVKDRPDVIALKEREEFWWATVTGRPMRKAKDNKKAEEEEES